MADWSKPTITSNYVTFVDEVKNRDLDAITLQLNALTNPPVGSIRLLRAPTKFQEWDGTQFVDKILAVAGGGTGSSTPGGAVSALGLGTMSLQNANAVAITGGTLTNLHTYNRLDCDGVISIVCSPAIQGGYGLYISGADGQFPVVIFSSATGAGHGVSLAAGNNRFDSAVVVTNRSGSKQGFAINGGMEVSIATGLLIPVGADKWVPN
jgi:hypothetical protein